MEHIILEDKKSAKIPELKGSVGFFYMLINTPDAEWDAASKDNLTDTAGKVASFFEKEAAQKGVYLRITSAMACGSLLHTVSVSDDSEAQKKELVSAFGFSDMDSMRNTYKAKYGVDEPLFCFTFRAEGRAFACEKYMVVFKDARENVVIHEFCHMCGAMDLYYPELLREKTRQHFGKSVMLNSEELVIDPLTAYLIGWDKSPDRTASAFLRDTAGITRKQILDARKEQTKTGYVTACTEYGEYKGNLVDGFRNGFGIFSYADGGRYEGEWKNDMKSGKGTFFYADGARYEGEWKDDKKSGRGTCFYADGGRYEGEWKNGVRNGRGTCFYAGGSRYEGEWKDDVRSGKGVYVYAGGSHYEGEWKDDVRSGKGTYVYTDGSRYAGEWKNNMKNGRGTFSYANGALYKGEWKDNKKSGRGTEFHTDGTRYEGEWRDGKPNGRGAYVFADGSSKDGIWRDGTFSG